MRDENQPVLRRQRAATQILNRKGKRDWVPDAIPAGEKPLRPWDGFEIEEDLATTTNGRTDGSRPASNSQPPTPGNGSAAEGPVAATGAAGEIPGDATDPASRDAKAGDGSTGDASPNAEPAKQPTDLANSAPEATSQKPEADPPPAAPPAAPPPMPPKPRKRETVLTDQFLAATFLHKHEPREAFERLLRNQLRAYAPATPQEEILTLRITQKSWILRRLDTFDRVIADSAVTKVREQHPNAAPAACIAMTFLTRNDTEETRFHDRIAKLRREHEAMHDRLESKLHTLQERRIAREDRHRGGPALHGHPQGGLSGSKVVEMTPGAEWQAVSG
jgi:hypothetical protein